MRMEQSPNWPWPPVCFLCRPCASVAAVIVSRYGIFGGLRFTSTPNRRFSLATVTSMCSWPWPESSSSLVCASRLDRIVGSSSCRRWSDELILSSSPRLFGSIAYDRTGSGNSIGLNTTPPLSASVLLVTVSFSLATAPMSPALISGTSVCVFPCSSTRWPSRSGVSLIRLYTVVSALSDPLITRNMLMRPANGSATVFHTNAAYGPLSDARTSTSWPPLVPLAGRSDGAGT